MDCHTVESLWECVTKLEAQELLLQFKASDWSSLKQEDRTKLYKDLSKSAYNSEWNKQETVSNADIAQMFGGF